MTLSKSVQLKGSTCKVCGRAILSKTGKAELCQDKSTCRVAWARKQKGLQKEAEKMTVSLEQFALYELVGKADYEMKMALDHMLRTHGKDAFSWMLVSVSRLMKVSV